MFSGLLDYKIYKPKDNTVRILLYSKQLTLFLKDHFGTGAKNKKLPQWIFGLNNISL